MRFEVIAREKVSRRSNDTDLTLQDKSHNILMIDASSIEVAYDSEADPADPACRGNYRVRVTSRLREIYIKLSRLTPPAHV